MSIQAIAWVLEQSEATLADRLVLLAIANHADARGWNAYPSVPRIAEEARVAEATVYRSLSTLEQSGELIVHRHPGRSNKYVIAALNPSQIERGNPSQIERGPLASTRKTPRKLRPEPSLTVNQPSRVRARNPMPPPLPQEVRAKGAEFFRALRTGDTQP
jgi:hypothetical protein